MCRRFPRGLGMAAGVLALAPAIAACRGAARPSTGGHAASREGGARPVKGEGLTCRTLADVINLGHASSTGMNGKVIIASYVEPLMTVDAQTARRQSAGRIAPEAERAGIIESFITEDGGRILVAAG